MCNKNNSLFLLTLISLSTLNCKKHWLEEKSDKSLAVPARLKDFQAILDNSIRMNNHVFAFGELAADGHYISESSWAAAGEIAKNVYTWSKNSPYTQLEGWVFTFSRIFFCNIVLDELKKFSAITQNDLQQANSIKGQALFNRAISFFNLSQTFAEPYDKDNASEKYGIPMRLDSDVSQSSHRFSVSETYEQIISDLEDAATLLPEKALYATRGSKAAAYALLAKVYLVMEDYENAFSYADKCLQLQDDLLDFSTLSEGLSDIAGNFGSVLHNPEVIFFDRIYSGDLSELLSINCLIDTALYALYQDNDLRRSRFFSTNLSNREIYFKGNYNYGVFNLFCGIATDEIFLLRAECSVRLGRVSEAMVDLNHLLSRRYDSTFIPLNISNSLEVLDLVLQERRKELLLRNVRWSDLRRLNRDPRFQLTLTRTIGGNNYFLEPNSFKYTFPIPDDIISISGMPQTPGW